MIHTRLYIDKNTKNIMFCEADSRDGLFDRGLMTFGEDDKSADDVGFVVVKVSVDNPKDPEYYEDAENFIDEDIEIEGFVTRGASIFKVNDDFTVELCAKKCRKNKGTIDTVKPLTITYCEVLNNGNTI